MAHALPSMFQLVALAVQFLIEVEQNLVGHLWMVVMG